MEIRPAEISEILKKQIAAFDTEQNVAETGQVLSVGDGIARVFGLQNVMAGELVERLLAGEQPRLVVPRGRQSGEQLEQHGRRCTRVVRKG